MTTARELGDSTTFENYVERAISTECPYDPVNERLSKEIGQIGSRLAHMSLGISNENGEIHEAIAIHLNDKKESTLLVVREELGDLMWYCAGACDVVQLPSFDKLVDREPLDPEASADLYDVFQMLAVGAGGFAEQVKKHVFYGKPADHNKLIVGLRLVVSAAQSLALFFDLDFKQILKDNIAKLATRFPDKFTEMDAIDRDKDAEYEAMDE